MKKLLLVAGVVLVLFFVITRPAQAANFTENLFDMLVEGGEALITFLERLFATMTPQLANLIEDGSDKLAQGTEALVSSLKSSLK